MRTFTYVSSYYDQPALAELWWENLANWDRELSERIPLIFVDDGSPRWPLAVPSEIRERFNVRLFRVLDDIPWNEMGARNLAMKQIGGWALLMDADYVLSKDQAHRMLGLNPNKRDLYLPRAREHGKTEHLHHPVNLFLVHSEAYWKCGGYHEEYAGAYGLSDTEFLRIHAHGLCGARVKLQDVWIEHFMNRPVSWLDRSLTRNDRLFRTRLKMQQKMGALKLAKMNVHLRFKWREEWTS